MSIFAIDISAPTHCLEVARGLSSQSTCVPSFPPADAPQPKADLLVIGGGGGPGSTGLVNKLCCLDWDETGIGLKQCSEVTFLPSEDAPWSVALSPDASLIAIGVNAPEEENLNRNCRILSRSDKHDLKQIKSFVTTSPEKGTCDFQCAAAFSPNGSHLATGSDVGVLSVLNTTGFTQLDWAPISVGSKIFNVCFTHDSTKVIVTSKLCLRVYKVDSGELLLEVEPPAHHTFRSGCMGLDSVFYTVVNNLHQRSILSVWNLDKPNKPIKSVTISNKPAVSFTIRDDLAVVGLVDCSLIILRGLKRIALHRNAHDVPIATIGIAQSPIGSRVIVSASGDGFVKVWPCPPRNVMTAFVPSVVHPPLVIAFIALLLASWVTWLALGALVPGEQLIQLGIPFLSIGGGQLRFVAAHVPWLKDVGIAQVFG